MSIKERILQILPASLIRTLRLRTEIRQLQRVPRLKCNVTTLRSRHGVALNELFTSREIEVGWAEIKKRIDRFLIPDKTGGVNFGDRKALYYLISWFGSSSVLEIGTHIGASTVHIASALFTTRIQRGRSAHLVSVDIADVNDSVSKPWLKYGAGHSPMEMIEEMDFKPFVEFVRDTSLDYFGRCVQRFDFIFLDGDHAAKTVYTEIPAALNLLREDGVILLHDYFANLKPLWSDGSVIPGPFVATERLKAEGANLIVLPLGELPWPTKLRSNITSLALVLKEGR